MMRQRFSAAQPIDDDLILLLAWNVPVPFRYWIDAGPNQRSALSGLFARLLQRHAASARRAQAGLAERAVPCVEESPTPPAIGRDREIEVAAVRMPARLGNRPGGLRCQRLSARAISPASGPNSGPNIGSPGEYVKRYERTASHSARKLGDASRLVGWPAYPRDWNIEPASGVCSSKVIAKCPSRPGRKLRARRA